MEPLQTDPQMNPARWSGLRTRIVSAAALAAIVGICLWQGGILFIALIILAALILKAEWDGLLSRYPQPALRWVGYPYIVVPCACFLWLRDLATPLAPDLGLRLCVVLIAVICATDIGAYFIGKRFGSHKLAPNISPGKTWEGLAGGVFIAGVIGMVLSTAIPLLHSPFAALMLSALLALLAQAGDLFESWIKRRADVKDSGSLMPGHGGLLDRLDGYMFTVPLFSLVIASALHP